MTDATDATDVTHRLTATPEAARPKAPVAALTGLFLIALLGCWLIAAPFLLGDQTLGAAWSTATRVDVATGAAVTATAVVALMAYLAAAIHWLARYGR